MHNDGGSLKAAGGIQYRGIKTRKTDFILHYGDGLMTLFGVDVNL